AGRSFEGPPGGAAGLNPKGSGGTKENVGVAETAAWPRAGETHATTLEVGAPGRTAAPVFALAPGTPPAIVRDRDCSDFKNQKRAQRWFNKHHPRGDPSR